MAENPAETIINDGVYDLENDPNNYNFEGFRPGTGGGKDCADYQAWGVPSTIYSYIVKGNANPDTYPEDACEPYYHYTGKIDYLRVNVQLEGPGGTGAFGVASSLVTFSNAVTVTGLLTAGSLNVPGAKLFDIPHPSPGKENKRLRHACIEGPEAAVYYRGKLSGGNTIKLPDYWKDLVREDTITVQLQPIGDRHFHINVCSYNTSEIVVKEADDKPFECFYHVYGERKDVDPIEVEVDA